MSTQEQKKMITKLSKLSREQQQQINDIISVMEMKKKSEQEEDKKKQDKKQEEDKKYNEVKIRIDSWLTKTYDAKKVCLICLIFTNRRKYISGKY